MINYRSPKGNTFLAGLISFSVFFLRLPFGHTLQQSVPSLWDRAGCAERCVSLVSLPNVPHNVDDESNNRVESAPPNR